MIGILRFITITMLATGSLLFSAPAPVQAKPITAVILRDLQPSSFVDRKTDQPTGFAVDLTNAVAAEAGLQVQYLVVNNWQEAEDALKTGQADICPVLVVNPKRQTFFLFTDYTETSGVRIIIRTKSGSIAGLPDLYNRPVGTLRASQAYQLLKNENRITLTFYDSYQQAIMELLAGRIDAFVGPDNIVLQLTREAGIEDQIKMLEPPLIEIKRAIAVAKNNPELYRQLRGPTAAFVTSPAYKALYTKWYGSPAPFWNTTKVVLLLTILTLSALIALAIWRYFLLIGYNRRISDSERRFRGIFDQTLQMIGLLDAKGRLIEVNQTALDLVATTLDQVRGQLFWDTPWWNHDPAQQVRLQQAMAEAMEGELVRMVAKHRSAQGAIHYVDFSIKPVFDDNGKVCLLIPEGRDITERIKTEQELHEKAVLLEQEIGERQKAQEALQLLNNTLEQRISEAVTQLRQKDDMLIQQNRMAALGELLTNIAHQWRQPLNNIAVYIQTMQYLQRAGELTDEEMDRDIKAVMEILQYMSQTIDDFRSFFVRDRSSAREFALAPTIDKALTLVTPSLTASNIKVTLLKDQRQDLRITGYPNEFIQVVMNILYNARDIMLERKVTDPYIEIMVAEDNGKTVTTIRDNGGGVEQQALPHIFDPYFTTKGPDKGTGIGLYMSKNIIEKNMGGKLTARNVENGAEFRIEI
ncbi:MAG: transporter substrate-binding domain-containing protein [Geobacter sp.]